MDRVLAGGVPGASQDQFEAVAKPGETRPSPDSRNSPPLPRFAKCIRWALMLVWGTYPRVTSAPHVYISRHGTGALAMEAGISTIGGGGPAPLRSVTALRSQGGHTEPGPVLARTYGAGEDIASQVCGAGQAIRSPLGQMEPTRPSPPSHYAVMQAQSDRYVLVGSLTTPDAGRGGTAHLRRELRALAVMTPDALDQDTLRPRWVARIVQLGSSAFLPVESEVVASRSGTWTHPRGRAKESLSTRT